MKTVSLNLVWAVVACAALCWASFGQSPADRVAADQLVKEGKFRDAARAFEALIVSSPSDPSLYHQAALAYARCRRFHEAVQKLDFARRLKPDDPALLFDLASSYMNSARFSEALNAWRELESIGHLHPLIGQRPEIPFHRGTCASKLSLVPEAVEALGRAVSMAPDRIDYLEQLAGELINATRYAEALPHLKALVAKAPSNARHHYHLGVAAMQTGDDALADAELKEARRLNPKHVEASLRLARLYQRLKKNDLAFSLYFECSEKNPLSSEAWYGLTRMATLRNDAGMTAEFQAKYDEVKKLEETAENELRDLARRVVTNPNDVDAHFETAVRYLKNDQSTAALESLQKILIVDPHHELALMNVASLLGRMQDFQGSAFELEKILERKPAHPFANLEIGRAFYFLRRVDHAVAPLIKAVETIPPEDERYLHAVELLAESATAAKAAPRALPALTTAARTLAGRGEAEVRALLRLAQVAESASKLNEIVPLLEKALPSLNPELSGARQIASLLARLAEAAGDRERAQRFREFGTGR